MVRTSTRTFTLLDGELFVRFCEDRFDVGRHPLERRDYRRIEGSHPGDRGLGTVTRLDHCRYGAHSGMVKIAGQGFGTHERQP
jgi:hypothetical protein